jgi:phosphatidate cytidylyltransferase
VAAGPPPKEGGPVTDPTAPAVPDPAAPAAPVPPPANQPGPPEQPAGPPEPPGDQPGPPPAGRQATRTGRNLPVAAAVGVLLGGLAIVTLFTLKATFLVLVALAVGGALWEVSRAFANRNLTIPVIPVGAAAAALLALAYWSGVQATLAAFVISVIVLLAWRLPSGAEGYVRDVTASVFVLAYVPLLATFVALMLASEDGPRRVVIFVALAVCSDVGGYFAGILLGKHPMAPRISPRKTWEGLAGSLLAGLIGGAVLLVTLLHGHWWQGALLGIAAVAAAVLGDLVESMVKRDLDIKDMGNILPGHGGVMERIDSLLIVAPVAWLLLTVFIPHAAH